MKRLKVLLATSEFPPRIGGVATHVAELANALQGAGVEITVVAPAKPAGDAEAPGIIRYSPRWRGQPVSDWLLSRFLRRLHRAQHFDLVHVHGLRPLRAATTLGIPVVFTNHTSGFLKTVAAGGRRLERLGAVIKRSAHVIAPSEELVDAARLAGYTGPASYIPNGVDAERFTPGEGPALRRIWGIPSDGVVVVIARRLAPKNGVLDAARALALTPARVHFVFAGEGSERAAIESEVAASGVAARAHLIGAVPNPRMVEVYRAADFCLLPSHMEATSIAGLEAMACGKALVGTRVGGIPALIAEGETGLLVPAHSPAAIAEAVTRLAEDPAGTRAMGIAARARVLDAFAWPRIAAATLDLYRQLSADRGEEGASGS